MNNIQLSGITISKKIDNVDGTIVANVLLCDNSNPTKLVFKISIWGEDAKVLANSLDAGDEITIHGKIYGIGSNKHGSYIDVRQCQLLRVVKVERKAVFQTEEKYEEDHE